MKAKILIVDDDHDFLEATSVLLQAQGYETITASHGEEGFARIKHESPDLILLDMMMRYKSEGIDIARAVATDAASRQTPIILITGAHKESAVLQTLKADRTALSIKAILEKPVSPETLLQTIRQSLNEQERHHMIMVRELEQLAEKWRGKSGNLVMILHEIQNHYRYVPRQVSFELSRILDIPMARLYEVLTFYNYFKIDPPGKHTISVCMGTACYLKGAPQILKEFKRMLNVAEEHSTSDGLFHLQVVRCLGCCGLAPVIMVGDKVYSKVKETDVTDILSEYVNKEGARQ